MNIYLILTKKINQKNIDGHLDLQRKIVNFLQTNIAGKIRINIIYADKHLYEKDLEEIDFNNDVILWHPIVAHNNLTLLTTMKNAIVILLKKTVLIQRISENNPINENMAINHNFQIMYIDPTNDDITNEDYTILGYEDDYLYTIEKLLKQIETWKNISL